MGEAGTKPCNFGKSERIAGSRSRSAIPDVKMKPALRNEEARDAICKLLMSLIGAPSTAVVSIRA